MESQKEKIAKWKSENKQKINETLKKWGKKEKICEICNKKLTKASYYPHLKSKKHQRNQQIEESFKN